MVFKRRHKPSFWSRMRSFFAPRGGWRRALEYMGHRLKRLPDTPHKIALGVACGAFVSFSPLFGFHFVYAGLCAYILRANMIASFIGTIFGNPITFPFIAAASLTTGRRVFGLGSGESDFSVISAAFSDAFSGLWQSFWALFGFGPSALDKLADFWWEFFLPYTIGGVLPGLVAGVVVYLVGRPLVAAYQARRRSRLLAKAKSRLGSVRRTADLPK